MNEELEYAEMLEIPVSTVNVVRKKKKLHGREKGGLKEQLISKVNNRKKDTFDESKQEDEVINTENNDEKLDTVFLSNHEKIEYDEDRGAINQKKDRKYGIVLAIESGVACVLCVGIFLTNVFMPESAINTFFKGISNKNKEDNRVYSDFELTGVVNSFSDTELNLSEDGILSFMDDCCVYPAVSGEVEDLTKADGKYIIKISHGGDFYGIIKGLDYVYYQIGEKVCSNVPVGYTKGETPVEITMFSGDKMLDCYKIVEDNCLSWITEEEEKPEV